jgi:hypothetical protein
VIPDRTGAAGLLSLLSGLWRLTGGVFTPAVQRLEASLTTSLLALETDGCGSLG